MKPPLSLSLAWAGLFLAGGTVSAAAATPSFATPEQLWAGYDPRALPIEGEVAKEEVVDGVVLRTIYYTSEVTDGFKVRVVAYYGFPVGGKNLPAVMHLHGGGQNAMAEYVKFFAQRGYACLSVNWGGRPLEGKPENGRTDWGPLRYNQNGADTGSLYTVEPTPRSNSWYHWAIAGRRGLSFLEQQPEVDAGRLGMFGVSMGGQITWLIAGTDHRLRCASSVFGLALLYEPLPGIDGSEYVVQLKDRPLWRTALDPFAYAPRVGCPFLYLSATNDIHGRMDMIDRTLRAMPAEHWQTYALHMNHRAGPAEAPALEKWLDRWLKGGAAWPRPPELAMVPDHGTGTMHARLALPDSPAVRDVTMHYSADPYPQSRFWRTITPDRAPGVWTAVLPLTTTAQGLQAFANVHYESGLTLSTPFVRLDAAGLAAAGVRATDVPTSLIDDFARGAEDWFNVDTGANALLSEKEFYRTVAAGPRAPGGITWNPAVAGDWKFFTRKVGDAKWRGPAGSALRIDLSAERANKLVVVLSRNYVRPPAKELVYAATVPLRGGRTESVVIRPADFKNIDEGPALADWADVNVLGLVGRHVVSGKNRQRPDIELGGKWQGPAPVISRVEWVEAK
jgi:dienelactone hydrolase